MFPRRERLSRLGFTAVSADPNAKRAASPHFSVVFSKQVPEFAAAVVVSKKTEKSSIGRHLLKRRMREAIRSWKKTQANLHPCAVIVYARPGSGETSFADITNEIGGLLSRVAV